MTTRSSSPTNLNGHNRERESTVESPLSFRKGESETKKVMRLFY